MSPGREPGRDLDAAIAEKVMGLPPVQVLRDPKASEPGEVIRGWRTCPACASEHDYDESECTETKAWLADIGRFYLPLDYSTDNAAAISALEHHGKQYEIHRYSANEYRVRIWCAAQATCLYVTGDLAPTLAHAACLALLRSVEAQG